MQFDLYDGFKKMPKSLCIFFLINMESIWVSKNAGKMERQANKLMHFVRGKRLPVYNLSYDHLIM